MKELYDFTKWPFNLMLDIARYDRNQEDGNLSAEDEALSIPLLTLRNSIMETLSDRDADIIISLYMYGSTYASLANKYCITRGRISQIKGKSVRKLKEYIDRQQYIKAMTNTTASDVSGCNINDIPDSSKTPLKLMNLSVRSYNCLCKIGCKTAGDVAAMTKYELGRVRNIGKRSVDEIIGALNSIGLALNPDEPIIILDLPVCLVRKLNVLNITTVSQLKHAFNNGRIQNLFSEIELRTIVNVIRPINKSVHESCSEDSHDIFCSAT